MLPETTGPDQPGRDATRPGEAGADCALVVLDARGPGVAPMWACACGATFLDPQVAARHPPRADPLIA